MPLTAWPEPLRDALLILAIAAVGWLVRRRMED